MPGGVGWVRGGLCGSGVGWGRFRSGLGSEARIGIGWDWGRFVSGLEGRWTGIGLGWVGGLGFGVDWG